MNNSVTFTQEQMRTAQGLVYIQPMTFYDEVFLKVSDFIPEIRDIYYVSNYGRVCSTSFNTLKILAYNFHQDTGYVCVSLRTNSGKEKGMLVHRLVMRCFNPIPNHEDMAVNHIDGNKHNNHISNLEWVTDSENMIHCYRNNLEINGEDHPWATITEAQAHQICQLMEQGLPNRIISEKVFGDRDHIGIMQSIRGKHSWVNVSRNYNIDVPNPGKRIFTDDQLRQMLELTKTISNNVDVLRAIGIDVKSLNKNQISAMTRVVRQLRTKTGFNHIFENDN